MIRGDIAEIIDNKSGHRFQIGDLVVIYVYACEGYKVIDQGIIDEFGNFDKEQVEINWSYVDNRDVKKYVQ